MKIIFAFVFMYCSLSLVSAIKPNTLVKFLSGKWDNVSFEISDKKPIKKEQYPETMVIKDADTLTITAHGFRDRKDLTKDMRLEVRGDKVVLSKGDFKVSGNQTLLETGSGFCGSIV